MGKNETKERIETERLDSYLKPCGHIWLIVFEIMQLIKHINMLYGQQYYIVGAFQTIGKI